MIDKRSKYYYLTYLSISLLLSVIALAFYPLCGFSAFWGLLIGSATSHLIFELRSIAMAKFFRVTDRVKTFKFAWTLISWLIMLFAGLVFTAIMLINQYCPIDFSIKWMYPINPIAFLIGLLVFKLSIFISEIILQKVKRKEA